MTGDNPFVEAARVYDREPCARSFTEDLEAHLRHGWVISTPDLFLMARKISVAWSRDVVLNPYQTAHDNAADAWHVWLAAGNWRSAFAQAPHPLPWVVIERKNKLRYYDWNRFQRTALRPRPDRA